MTFGKSSWDKPAKGMIAKAFGLKTKKKNLFKKAGFR